MPKRETIKYKNDSNKFLLKTFDYQRQFSHLYAYRLNEMTKLLTPLAKKHWGDEHPIKKLCELREEEEDSCIIIGTLYKHQIHKPSILREISEENQLAPQPPRQHYADPEDKLILEDELQRVRLYGKVDTSRLATGVVCAVFGMIEENGLFDVEEILFYEAGPQRPLSEKSPGNNLLVLMSGIDFAESHEYPDSINLFQHWLCGNIMRKKADSGKAVHLIVAGNSVRSAAEKQVATLQMSTANSGATKSEDVSAMKFLDTLFSAWAHSITIDVMPGSFDPSNFMLPQQPFHPFMFPKASALTSFCCVPNPHACSLGETSVVGTSGQNINDMLRNTEITDPMEALENTLIWSHVAPTAPDTLACYPYVDSDPFIFRECPHIYFAGNCNKFETKMHKGRDGKRTRLVCVPSFSQTQSAVVVNLDSLECHEVKFAPKSA